MTIQITYLKNMKKSYFIIISKLNKLFLYILNSSISLYFQIGLELLFFFITIIH